MIARTAVVGAFMSALLVACAGVAPPSDTVRAVYLESVAAEMAAVLGSEVTTVVALQSFDPASDTVTFTTPDGLTHGLVVHTAMRDCARRREPGDRVRVRYTQGLAIAVEETAG